MPVNFIKIFQDSWNFILNQRQMALFFLLLLVIDNVFFRYLLNGVDPQSEGGGSTFLMLTVAGQVVNSLLILWFLSMITFISQQKPANLSNAFTYAVKKTPIFLLLNFLIVMPFSLAAASYVATGGGSLFALPSVLIGCYLFIRLCLAPYSYVLENSTFSQALKLVWLNGSGKRILPLFLFSLLVYLIPLIITLQLAPLASSIVMTLIVAAVSASISLFTLVFTYRFYQLFIDKNILRKFQ
ncbi:hypothetical protein [Testudinibacter sp. TR-2022]|uniref:hypothetical protein n=1 Tax=Testudinibacter sp. TR-2022 TaxID=2585029 RepID=UPI00111AD4DA|nr:hypothetical protein [Testudinibacter sp. TR-2022]TNH03987.1 hypothetical protein FHQ30_12440 [Pasteurellaceae bacterium Phil11]TNH19459.1 hypothetical protein FHQ29_12575 [Testudinibacter sp. TR-2022]TNH28963.1 hypothetical protein FHQ27_01505 [Testudinibacter sp. TR-2022]